MRIRRLTGKVAGISILVGLVVSFAIANDGDISWVAVGPGGGGAFMGVAVDPADGSRVLVGSDVGGIYRSANGASTFTNANAGSILDPNVTHNYAIESFAYSRQNSNIVYAGGLGGILKSTDAGLTWTQQFALVHPAVVAVDPTNDNNVFAASGAIQGNGGNGCIWRSTNGGTSYTGISLVSPPVTCTDFPISSRPNAYGIVINSAGTTLLVTTSKGLFKSTNSGATWTNLCSSGSCPSSLPASHIDFGGITYDPTGQAVYLVMHTKVDAPAPPPGEPYVNPNSWSGGVYKSTDWGKKWSKVNGNEGANLVTNGGFTQAGAPAAGWSYIAGISAFVQRVNVDGNWVIRIQTPDVNQGGPGVESNMIAVTGGSRLLVHARAKATQTAYLGGCCSSSFFGRLLFYDGSGGMVADNRCSVTPTFYNHQNLFAAQDMNTGWRDYESVYRVPAGATQVKVLFYTSDAQGTTLVDDIVVKQVVSLPRAHDFGGYSHSNYQTIVADPTVAGSLYVGTYGANYGNTDGIWKSTDAGATWTWDTRRPDNDNVLDKRTGLDPPTPNDPLIGCDSGSGYDPIYGLGIFGSGALGQETVYFATGFFYKKAAGSSNWENVTHDAGEATCTPSTNCPTWIGRGSINNIVVMDVKMAGTDMPKLFYGDSDNLFLNSQDGGVKFRQEGILNSVWFWVNPPYSAPGNAVASIAVKTPDEVFVSVYNRGLATTQGGILGGCYSTNPTTCVVPTNSADPSNTWIWTTHSAEGTNFPGGGPARLAYGSPYLYMALGTGRGVFRQQASSPGSSWDRASIGGDFTTWANPPTDFKPNLIVYDAPGNRLFVGTGDPYAGDTVANTGVWMNDLDAGSGTTWCKITPLTDVADKPYGEAAVSLTVGAAGEVFLGTANAAGGGHLGGLYKGAGGDCNSTWTWTKMTLNADPSNHGLVSGVAISPINPQIVYAAVAQENGTPDATRRAGIYKSVDGGLTFSKLDLNGLTSLRHPLLAYSPDGQSNLTLLIGSAGSGAFKGTVLTPAAPTGLIGDPAGSQQVDLEWADNSFAEQGYKIERRQAVGEWSEIFQAGPNVTSYHDNTPTGGHYIYRIRGFDEAGDSAYSNEVHVIVQN